MGKEIMAVAFCIRNLHAYNQNGELLGKIEGATRADEKQDYDEVNCLLYIKSEKIPISEVYYKKSEIDKKRKRMQMQVYEYQCELSQLSKESVMYENARNEIEKDIENQEMMIRIFDEYVSKHCIQ